MNSPAPMSRKELLELASLDALGLLEEYEAALFTRSFHQAPKSVRREVMELQAALAADALLLPSVEPAGALRKRAVSAVLEAAGGLTQLAPLATIGHSGGHADSDRDRRTSAHRAATTAETSRLIPTGGIWRAASFLLIGALLVSIFFNLRFLERIDAISDVALNARNDQQFERLVGRDIWMIAGNPATHRIALLPAAGESRPCVGYVLFDEGEMLPQVLVLGLPANEQYTITVSDDRGEIVKQVLHSPSFAGFARAIALDVPATETARVAAAKIEIHSSDGRLMLASA